MEINPILALCIGWVLGVLIGIEAFRFPGELPTLVAVWGFLLLAGLASTFYFGKVAPVILLGTGLLESGLIHAYPLAGMLLGIATIGAGMYGRTLGALALDDFYENGQTRLPGFTLAAMINFLLILGFGVIVWYLFAILPDARTLAQWLPLAGLGV